MARPLRRVLPLLLGAACLVFVAACGSDDNNDSSSSESTPAAAPPADTTSTPASGGGGGAKAGNVTLAAGENGATPFFYTPSKLTAKAGKVTFTVDNPQGNQAPHAIEIEGAGVEEKSGTAQPGSKATVTVNLKPGKYEFYCPIDGHKDAGMKGTLTVS
jgi:uncharacterized cupredoxin-like copper-binding protein